MAETSVSALYEWLGGSEALNRLTGELHLADDREIRSALAGYLESVGRPYIP